MNGIGSIERRTGWSGRHSDDPPSIAPAGPGAKLRAGNQLPELLRVQSEGEPMPLILERQNLDLDVHVAPALELRFAGGAEGSIEGYASTFGGKPDAYGDVIAPGAFAATLAQHKAAGTSPLMLWSHDPGEVIGRWTELREDAKGLLVKGQLNLGTQRGRETRELLKAGDVSGLSIGFRTRSFAVGNRGPGEPARILKAIELFEVSVVGLPANSGARVRGVKSAGAPLELADKAALVDLLRSVGLPRAAAQKIAAGGWPALTSSDPLADDLAKRIAAATAELKTLKG